MPKWRKDSTFGPGPRVALDREQRAQFRALLKLNRRPGRLSIAAAEIGRILLDMMGRDGRLDPCVDTIAARAAVNPSTVTRCLARLQELGFLTWTRRLARDAASGWAVRQISNAYALLVPCTDMHFAGAVPLRFSKKGSYPQGTDTQPRISDRENAARQIIALGLPLPSGW